MKSVVVSFLQAHLQLPPSSPFTFQLISMTYGWDYLQELFGGLHASPFMLVENPKCFNQHGMRLMATKLIPDVNELFRPIMTWKHAWVKIKNEMTAQLEAASLSFNCYTQSYLVTISCISVAEPLDVVEDEPGEGDDHEDDEGDGDKHYRCSAHVLLQVACSYSDVQHDHNVLLQQDHYLSTFRLWDHDDHNIACIYRNTCKTGSIRLDMQGICTD